MNLEIIILSKISHRERQIAYSAYYAASKKNDALIYKMETDSQT